MEQQLRRSGRDVHCSITLAGFYYLKAVECLTIDLLVPTDFASSDHDPGADYLERNARARKSNEH